MNIMQGVGGLEQHATGQQNGPRGPRAHQSYLNHFSPTEGNEPSQVMVDADNGGLITWGNVVEDDTLKSGVGLFVPRRCGTAGNCAGSAVDAGPPPGGWGYNGPVPLRTGVVDVSGTTVTHVSGDLFSTDWPAGSMIHISGATCSGSTSGTGCVISSVNSATSITLSTSSGAVNDGTYTTGSAWDGNTTATGYPALDQPGRGPGDLLSGDDFPDKVNTETDSVSWPNQVLEPIHVVMTTFTPAAGFGGALLGDSTAGRLTINVDYFTQTDGTQTAQVSNSSPFNGDGTPGVGWGTIANRPACSSGCVLGSVYLATDEGSWNTSTSNPEGVQRNGADGKFYVLTADGVWTARYGGGADNTTGEPYQYPHPLNVN
jgi:hypothetical protein